MAKKIIKLADQIKIAVATVNASLGKREYSRLVAALLGYKREFRRIATAKTIETIGETKKSDQIVCSINLKVEFSLEAEDKNLYEPMCSFIIDYLEEQGFKNITISALVKQTDGDGYFASVDFEIPKED